MSYLPTSSDWGSSPRVWGQVCIKEISVALFRIIPTRVGTSGYLHKTFPESRDHPHACGDKSLCVIFTRQCSGSSPRVWGQVLPTHQNSEFFRIIPTRVGTSFSRACDRPRRQDHPHACGDKAREETYKVTIRGSSPRVWGQVV